MTNIRSIGAVLSQLTQENNLSAIQLADKLGKSRQNVYNDFKRTSMRDDAIEDYAKALSISKDEIYARWKNTGEKQTFEGVDLLAEQMSKIEALFAQQLSIKDKQIDALLRTIDTLLGKSKCVTETTTRIVTLPTSKVDEMRA